MARRHVGGDVGGRFGATGDPTQRARAGCRRSRAGVLAILLLPLAACSGEEPSTEPPDPGAPITRSPS